MVIFPHSSKGSQAVQLCTADSRTREEADSVVASDSGCACEVVVGASVHDWQIANNVPQSAVLGHCFGKGLLSGSQLEVVQLTAPGVPDKPTPTPHLLAHPRGSPSTQVPMSAWMGIYIYMHTKSRTGTSAMLYPAIGTVRLQLQRQLVRTKPDRSGVAQTAR